MAKAFAQAREGVGNALEMILQGTVYASCLWGDIKFHLNPIRRNVAYFPVHSAENRGTQLHRTEGPVPTFGRPAFKSSATMCVIGQEAKDGWGSPFDSPWLRVRGSLSHTASIHPTSICLY